MIGSSYSSSDSAPRAPVRHAAYLVPLRSSWQLVVALILVPILVGALPLLLAYALIASSQGSTLERIETRVISHDLDTAMRVLHDRGLTLQRAAQDYGVWNGMDEAMRRGDLAWIRSEVDESVLATYGVSTIVILDGRDRQVLTLGRPLAQKLPPTLLTRADSGFAVVDPGAPVLVASSPIRAESSSARRDGTMIFAQAIDAGMLQDVAAATSNPIVILSARGTVIAGSTVLGDVPWSRLVPGEAAPTTLRRSGSWALVGQPLMLEAGPRSPLLAVVASRSEILGAEDAMRRRLVMALALILALAIAAGAMLSQYLLRPVHRISAALRSAATEPSGGQLPASGLGALGDLVQSFNSFSANLDTIVDARAQLAIRDAQLAGQARELEQLRDLERMRREFMANTSHELRTPLTIVLGYLESLEGNYRRMTDAQRLAGLRKAATGAQRLARLVEDILLVLRLEDGDFPLTRETFDLAELVRDAAAGIPLAYPGQPITIETGSTPILVESDANRVRQILINLLDNAAKYSTEGAPILVRCTEWEGSIRAEVVDCGPGIPPEQRERLFQRFGKTGSVGRSGRVGTGLGLAISKSLAEALGGRIEMESTVGTGSTFRLVLPRADSAIGLAHRHDIADPAALRAESLQAECEYPDDWYGRSMAG